MSSKDTITLRRACVAQEPVPNAPATAGHPDFTTQHACDAPLKGATEVEIPRELGAIRLQTRIGAGGMGQVFLGWDRMLQRNVAVKLLLNIVADKSDPAFEHLIAGARAAASVRHANLTALFHAGVVENVPYLVMDYIEGPTLGQLASALPGRRLSLHSLLAVFGPVCAAVEALHQHDFVHRDIKPANVLVSRGGEVFVTDFGLVCSRRASDGTIAPHAIAGTPAYMAPEMFEGSASARTDVYALGIMAFELLTGGKPFTGTFETLYRAHRLEPLPEAALATLDHAIGDVLVRATHKQAMFRYRSVGQFFDALRLTCPDYPVQADRRAIAELMERTRVDAQDRVVGPRSQADGPEYYQNVAQAASEKRAAKVPEDWQERCACSEVRSAGSETILADVPCVKCTYLLKGLSAQSRCPECGTDISRSLNPNRLVFADPDWLRRVIGGMRILHCGALGRVPIFLLVPLFGSLLSVMFALFPALRTRAGAIVASAGVLTCIFAQCTCGGWLALSREAIGRRHASLEQWRRGLRAGIVAAVVISIVFLLLLLAGVMFFLSQLTLTWTFLSVASGLASLIAWSAVCAALPRYLARRAASDPSVSVVGAQLVGWIICAWLPLCFLAAYSRRIPSDDLIAVFAGCVVYWAFVRALSQMSAGYEAALKANLGPLLGAS